MYPEGTKYIVIELQKNSEGTVGSFVWTYDNKNEAESKYYTVLSTAAISNVPKHSVVILHEEGFVIRSESYTHYQNEE